MINLYKSRKNDFKIKILGYFNIFSFIMIITALPIKGQAVYQTIANRSTILVKGTSNLHDWESKTQDITGEMHPSVDNNLIKKIESVIVKVQVTSIKSDKSAMDSKTYEALNSKKYPVVSYQSKNISLSINHEITSIGDLTINGVTRNKVVKATYSISPDGIITVKGNAQLKMTDFAVKPPTALLGTLKTGNDVELQFDISFKSTKSITSK